jgi:aerobic carbon-monoxide dehydrogenase medium subunit
MHPANFDYYRASTVDEAIALLQEHGFEAKLLAGGHSLLPMMKLRLAQPSVLIDIGRIGELRGIHCDEGKFTIGALTTQADVAASRELWDRATALAEAASKIGDVQVRNLATIGGNLAHADPASDLPAVMLALGAELQTRGPGGERWLAASDFFHGLFTTALEETELLTSLSVLAHADTEGSAYEKFENPASGYAIIGVAAWVRREGTGESARTTSARVAVNGLLDRAVRLQGVEAALMAGRDIEEAAGRALEGLDPGEFMSDIHASASYRAHLLKTLTRRALSHATERVTNQPHS